MECTQLLKCHTHKFIPKLIEAKLLNANHMNPWTV